MENFKNKIREIESTLLGIVFIGLGFALLFVKKSPSDTFLYVNAGAIVVGVYLIITDNDSRKRHIDMVFSLFTKNKKNTGE